MKIKLLSVLALGLLFASCEKSTDEIALNEETTLDNIKVSSSFDWSTTNEINFSIGTSDARYQNLIHVISIYDMDPDKGGKILAKGSATLISPFNTKIAFARATKSVYVVKNAPNGTKMGQEVLLSSANINLSFSATSVSQLGTRGIDANNLLAVTSTSAAVIPSCGRATTSRSINVAAGEVVCFSSTTDATIDIQANSNSGGTVKISAPGRTISLQNFNQNTGLSIIVDANTTLVFRDTEIRTGQTWVNNGTLEFNGKLTLVGTLENNGTLKLTSHETTAAGTLNNFGTLTATSKVDLAGRFNNNNSATFTELQLNSGAVVNNYCKLIADKIEANAVINNYSYILSKNTFKANSNGKVNMIGSSVSGAYFETQKIDKGSNDVYFHGTNATSIVKAGSIDQNLVNETNNPGRPIVTGSIQLWTSTTVSNNFFTAPATRGNGAYVAGNSCMPVSNGTAPAPVVTDRDGDGVPDKDDDFPDTKSKAYKNYSLNYEAGGSTLAFEDNWPVKGDYDLNDVVITYRYLVVTNAQNKVVEINAGYKLIATGADYINGAGVEFPLTAGKATITSAPTGAYLESGQTNVVLVLFENSRKLQATGNTVVGKPASPAVNFEVVLEVTDGPELKNFGTVAYNPFIWNATNGFGRGYETHLFGKAPTSRANMDLFDTRDDFSKSNNKYYSTKDNLPWVIEVPIANFSYPVEGAKIDKAYTNFSNWATSSGTSSAQWYSILSGGANSSLIYPVK